MERNISGFKKKFFFKVKCSNNVQWAETDQKLGLSHIEPGQAVKIGNAPVQITGASSRGISGYNLNCRGVELSVKLWRSQEEQWASNYYITWCTGSSISWREDAGMRTMSQRGWAPRPSVQQPRRTGKKRCYGHKSWGQYVAVLFSLPLTSHTVKPLVTLLNPFK